MVYKNEFKEALLKNLILKSKILAVIMAVILGMQIIVLRFVYTQAEIKNLTGSGNMFLIGPALLLIGLIIELLAMLYYKKQEKKTTDFKDHIVYALSFVEISFPSVIIIFAVNHLTKSGAITPGIIMTSPPMLMYFVIIILSALTLNARVSFFIGVIAAIEYGLLVNHYSPLLQNIMEVRNSFLRCVLLIMSGAAASFVSKRILEAVNSAIESKDTLINQLDKKVEERTVEINLQKEELKEKNKEIIDSITYAKRLQDAILPGDIFLKEALTNYFLVYKPKDIVAGDFYWIDRIDNKIWLAVCDCTGHGVPGAMVSVLCSNALSQALNQYNARDPAEALSITRNILQATFQKSEQEVKDGMDCVLCCFDYDSLQLQFAAANNSLYLLRAGSALQEFKADKMPVGKHSEKSTSFTLQQIQLQKGDLIYMFTDGYADQFGGPKGKKFKYKQLEDLITAGSQLPLEDQKIKLESGFTNWIGNLEQVDDVCLMGIRI